MHAEEISTASKLAKRLLTILCVTLMLLLGSATVVQALSFGAQVAPQQGYAQVSWGLGVVVPDGSALSGGGSVNWAVVTNVTAVVQIPEITNTSATIYAVVSLMTQDGVVLQTAFGVYPGNGSWLVYSMFIEDINQIPQHYTWAINSSEPTAEPGDVVTISIYQSPARVWSFRACNLNTSLSVDRAFGTNTTELPRRGDQEVFALESYASDSYTFRNMRNMTLSSLLVDGKRVASGWYLFADWDMVHNPLFVVGGGAPPSFIDVSILNDGRVVWYYSENWTGNSQVNETGPIFVALATLLGAALSGVLLSMRYVRKAAGSQGEAETGQGQPEQNRLKYSNLDFRRVWR
jgi:hypothetical protein